MLGDMSECPLQHALPCAEVKRGPRVMLLNELVPIRAQVCDMVHMHLSRGRFFQNGFEVYCIQLISGRIGYRP